MQSHTFAAAAFTVQVKQNIHNPRDSDFKLTKTGTFRQFPLSCDRFGFFAANGGTTAADAAHHRHGIIITASL